MLRDPGDGLEGDRILAESPGGLGLLLWRIAGDVTLWGMAPRRERGRLFAGESAAARRALRAAAELSGRVAGPVDSLLGLLAEPNRSDADIVSLCCLEVAAWTRAAGLPHTAMAFAQAGAVAAPGSSEAALLVGICARAGGQAARADTWLRRTIAVARRERNWAAYSAALMELGALQEGWGRMLRAEGLYRRAMRASGRYRARAERMRAAHALFRLLARRGDKAGAARFAIRAQRAYDADAAGAADLLLDLARFWTDVGELARAGAALRRMVPALVAMEPAGQLAALALAARAQATPGHAQSGAAAWRAAWVLLRNAELPDTVRYAAAMDLAHAARTSGDLGAFSWAKAAVLRLAPQAEYPDVAERMEKLWPHGAAPAMERAS